MVRAHHVKKARKDNPAVKAGESYWWWKFAFRAKQYSATRPKPSQLTQSAFMSDMYHICEDLSDMQSPADEIDGILDSIDELRDMTQDSFDNMPDQLQEADTGILLEERVDAMEAWRNDLEGIDMEIDEDLPDDKREDRLAEIFDEISGLEPGC